MNIAKILIPAPKLFPLYYTVPDGLTLQIGDLVIVPFRNKELTGIVWKIDAQISDHINGLRQIKQKIPLELNCNLEVLNFIKWISDYYLAPMGSVVKLVLPVDPAENPIKCYKQKISLDFVLPELSRAQATALTSLQATNKPCILRGVTGSGKTEIYFSLIAESIKQGKQVLVMLPEIALSEQIVNRFVERFGFEPVIWNSHVTKANKKKILMGILTQQVKVIIGARSSLFLPYKNLALIIVDEEHDDSYKQDDGILYNARDMAVVRANLCGARVVLCSATPSIETMHNAYQEKYQLIELSSRYNDASLPAIKIIDMKKEKSVRNSYLSSLLIDSIQRNLDAQKQTLLFLNRRGYSPLMLCKLCGYRFMCKFCSAWLVLHKSTKKLECHHCGYCHAIHIHCPECKVEDSLVACGPGVERVEEEIRLLFPDKCIATISKDQAKDPKKISDLLYKMRNSKIDILIGTQMITKGYHFPNLTLIGVIDADLGNIGGDLYASERSYQLLHQVGGRAGREECRGTVLIQTYYPDNIIFNHLLDNKGDNFLEYELSTRKAANMPPFTKMASIILSGKNEIRVFEIAKNLVRMAPMTEVIKILGPSSALMAKLASKYRYRILVVAEKKFNLQKYLTFWLEQIKIPSFCHIKIDIDPKSFY